MFDGDDEDEAHDPQGEGNYLELRIDFVLEEDEDGDPAADMRKAQVRTHVHHVPDQAVVDALLMVACGMVGREVGDRTFAENVPDFVQKGMTSAFVQMYMRQRIEHIVGEGLTMETIEIPNDISELLDD